MNQTIAPQLRLEGFEGPLEHLLTLIEQRRVPITHVSLAQVADQYLAYVHALPELDAEMLADFLQIAGKLLLLKSRALLLTEEPDPLVEETVAELEERLTTYRVFRAAAEQLHELEQQGARTYPTAREPQGSTLLPPLLPIAPLELAAALRRLQRARPEPKVEMSLPARASVDERRAHILAAVNEGRAVSFREVAGRTVDEVVATFLAVLELFRRGLVAVEQARLFGDLTITPPTFA